ncbi:MAG: prepilin-type N-terminal cleavage/methylation domain-containing protein [Candidatus Ozemobacteraceae bacterium]
MSRTSPRSNQQNAGRRIVEAGSRRRRTAFTLIELMMAVSILAVFLYYAYGLFIGGSKVAGKATWISSAVDQLRNTTQQLNIQLKSTSYPTTLLPDAIMDPAASGAPAGAAEKYYVKIISAMQIAAKDVPPSGKTIMSWVVCEPERPPASGTIIESELVYTPNDNTLVKVGRLRMRSKGKSFRTSPKDYAQSGVLITTPEPSLDRDIHLVDDVEVVRFIVPQCPSRELQPIKVEIRCQFPKDPKVFKENSLMITPNVGVGNL